MSLCWVTYDISDPKRLRRVHSLLLDYGAWQQLSVFSINVTEERLATLVAELRDEIEPEEDRVLILPMCSNCSNQIKVLGKTPAQFDPGYRII